MTEQDAPQKRRGSLTGDIDDELENARERISSTADPGERERAMFYAGYRAGIHWARSVIGKGDQST